MNIHDEYLKERGFEMTSEFRTVGKGDYYLKPVGESDIGYWDNEQTSLCKYLILKKLRQTYEFDGQTFEAPEGYVFERVGLVRRKDIGKYISSTPKGKIHTEITESLVEILMCPYFIFRNEN